MVQFAPKIFHFNRYISSEDAVEAIRADEQLNLWEPAKIEHLLAYSTKNPGEQRNCPIVGLGSIARVYSGRLLPCLHGDDAERRLGLSWCVADWNGHYRFLAVGTLASTNTG